MKRPIHLAWVLLACMVLGLPVLPGRAQSPPPDVRFGAVEAFYDPVAAAEAGVGWDRRIFYWSELQPLGPDDWNPWHVPDDWLDLANATGRQVVAVLKCTPEWAARDGQFCGGVPAGLELPVDDPGNLWANFIRRVVTMYAGRIDHWIIWNEPEIRPGVYGCEWLGTTEEYYRLLKVAYIVAKQANPNAVIHLAGLSYWHDPTYVRDFLTVAAQDPEAAPNHYFFDVVSLHIYFKADTIPDIIGATRSMLNERGLSGVPIWVNETNAPSNSDPPYWDLPGANYDISLEEQASFLLQAFALSLSAGAQRVAVYKWMDQGDVVGSEPFGIIRTDHSRRPAYDAYRVITTYYAGTQRATRRSQASYDEVTLDQSGKVTRVLWARTAAAVSLRVTALSPSALLVDQTGAQQTLVPVDGVYELALPGARCADKRGCIIGGRTFLLIEQAPGSGDGPIEAATATPSPVSPVDPLPSSTSTAVFTGTLPPASATPQPTPTPTPESHTPAPTATWTPLPTRRATATVVPELTPHPSPAAEFPTRAATLPAVPDPASGSAPDVPGGQAAGAWWPWGLGLALLAAAGLVGGAVLRQSRAR